MRDISPTSPTAKLKTSGLLWLLIAALGASFATTEVAQAQAQDVPKVISPLRVDPDVNAVNVVTGKVAIPSPTISVPAAPNLKFDGALNAAPYVLGTITGPAPSGVGAATDMYSIHTGAGGSESFRCFDYDNCLSLNGSGSRFEAFANLFTQADTGAIYQFDRLHSDTTSGGSITSRTVQYYASSVSYPNGEIISYTYDTYLLITGSIRRTFYRPITISSNLGYAVSVSYQSNTFATYGWSAPAQATLYATSNPGVPLARLNYSAPVNGEITITDLGGRVRKCWGCAGANIETDAGTATLPTEGAPSVQVAASSQVTASTSGSLVGSVTRDGVAWTYSYTNPRLNGQLSNWIYDGLAVAGPNGFSQFYTITQRNVGGPGTQANVISSIRDSINRTTGVTFDATLRPVAMTFPEGNVVNLAYDSYGNITSKVTKAKPGSGLADITESAFVDTLACGGVLCYRPTWVKDGKGNQTDFIYNGAGQLIEQTDPPDASGVRRKTYVTYESFPVGSSLLYRKKVVRVCGTGGVCGSTSEIRTEYDYWQNTFLPSVMRQIDAARGITLTTSYAYDAAGRVLSVDGPLPGSDDAVYYRYDILGRKTWEIGSKMVNGLRKATRTTYRDSDDKVTLTEMGTVPDPTSTALTLVEQTSTSYDTRRNPIRMMRSAGGTTYAVADSAYDDRGRATCKTVRMTPSLWASQTDACVPNVPASGEADRVTKLGYDAASQLLKTTVAFGSAQQADDETNSYTQNGKLQTVTDGENNTTTFEYDGHDRLFKTRYPVPTLGALSSSTTDFEQYTYDFNGNVTQRRLRDGQLINNTFDNLNRLTLKDVPNLVSGEQDVTYAYDLGNRVTSLTNPGGTPITYSYDALGRRLTESFNTYTKTSGYDAASRRTSLTLPGSALTINYDYDAAGNMTAVRENGATTGLGVLATYGYDNLGRRTSITRGNGTITSYGYDAVSRLASFGQDLASTTNDLSVSSISYNPASQQISQTRSNDSYAWSGHYNINRAYGTNGLNQLTTAGATALGYDGRGNLTSSGTTTYNYTSENRMALSQVAGQPGVAMLYDLSGRLWQLTKAASVTRFDYDGSDLVMETDGAGNILRRYVPGAGTDEPLVWYEGTGLADKRWLHTDERGSIIAISNTAGTSIALNKYDEFGIPLSTNMGRFGYTGQTWLGEVGLNYYKARMYSPTLGRFMQTDPIGYKDGINWYDYVDGDPVDRSDPTGLADWEREPNTSSRVGGYGQAGVYAGDHALGDVDRVANAAPNSGSSASSAAAAGRGGVFTPPTNAPTDPTLLGSPTAAPRGGGLIGHGPGGTTIRIQPASPETAARGYPNGYWVPTKNGQAIDPATGKPPGNMPSSDAAARTHIPLPENSRYNQNTQTISNIRRVFAIAGPVAAAIACAIFCESAGY